MRIGLLAERAGASVPTIRYYEEIGLLRPAIRQSGGQRTYDHEDVRRLTFVRRCREFGFSIDEVRALLSLTTDRITPCSNARDLAAAHLSAVQSKLRESKSLELSIAALISNCDTTCADGKAADCCIFEDLRA